MVFSLTHPRHFPIAVKFPDISNFFSDNWSPWLQKLTARDGVTFSMNAMANPTNARCMSNETAKFGCRTFTDCSTERGTVSKYVLAPAGGAGLCWLTARIRHSMSAVSRMYVLMIIINSFFSKSGRTSGCADLGCRRRTYTLRHLHTLYTCHHPLNCRIHGNCS